MPIGDATHTHAVVTTANLHSKNIHTDIAYGKRNLKNTIKNTDRSDTHYAVVLNDRNIKNNVAQIKNLQSGEQSPIPLDSLVHVLKKKFL